MAACQRMERVGKNTGRSVGRATDLGLAELLGHVGSEGLGEGRARGLARRTVRADGPNCHGRGHGIICDVGIVFENWRYSAKPVPSMVCRGDTRATTWQGQHDRRVGLEEDPGFGESRPL